MTIFREIIRRKLLGRPLEKNLDAVGDLRATWDKLYRHLVNNLAPSAVHARAVADMKRHGKAIRDGAHPGVTIHSPESAESHAVGERVALQLQLGDVSEEAAVLEQPIWAKLAVAAKMLADEMDGTDQKAYAAFGVGYSPSELVHALRKAADQASFRSTQDPRAMRGSKPGGQLLDLK